MEVLSYVKRIWIHPSELFELQDVPYLMVNKKAFYEATAYFKEKCNIEVGYALLESTDDHGVVLAIYVNEDTDITILKQIPDLFRIGVEQDCDECGNTSCYLKLYISINQQMENV